MTTAREPQTVSKPEEPYWVRKPGVTVGVCLGVLGLLIALGLAFLADLGKQHEQLFRFASDSMEPTLHKGELVLVQNEAYTAHPPQRGDIVTFLTARGDVVLIKRVIAIGGDTISGTPDSTFVNGQKLSEPYLKHARSGEVDDPRETFPEETFGPIRVPPHCFFVMGDNRDDSYDSRMPQFGCVPLDRIRGKAVSAGSSRIRVALSKGRKLQ